MTTNFFSGLSTVAEIRKHYFKLAMRFHPDRGGDLETMKALNNAYEAALRTCDGKEQPIEGDKEKRTYKFTFRQPEEAALVETLSRTLAAKMPGVVIALMGSWIWLTGETKANKDAIKSIGYKYSSGKESWYYHSGKFYSKSRGKYSLDDIEKRYGRYQYNSSQQAIDA